MPQDKHTLAMQSPDEVIQLPGEQSIPTVFSKKLYKPPELVLLLELNISNNASGDGDGDAALAHS